MSARQALGPDGFLFANISSCAIDDVLELARQASASGARPDALLCLPPFYHAPVSAALGAAGVEAFFRAVLTRLPDDSPPLFVYTFAVHTQQPVPPDVFGRLCRDFPGRCTGIKASAVSVAEAQEYAEAAPDASVLLGNGRANLPALRAGLSIVSGDCVTVAWALARLCSMVSEGDDAGADAAQRALLEIWRAKCMDGFDEVPAVKASFATITDVATGTLVRPPLVALDATEVAAIQTWREELRVAFAAIPSVALSASSGTEDLLARRRAMLASMTNKAAPAAAPSP